MTGTEIIARVRLSFLADNKNPKLWSDAELIWALDTVYHEWCRDTLCIRDATTTAICNIALVANTYLYARDERILSIENGRLSSGGIVLPRTRAQMDYMNTTWRDDDGGSPYYLINDYTSGYFRISPYYPSTWTGSDTIYLDVIRLPITRLTAPSQTPEIRYDHHVFLIDGVLREAYLKPDTDTFDPQLSVRYGTRFEENKDKAREQSILLDGTYEVFVPHYATI